VGSDGKGGGVLGRRKGGVLYALRGKGSTWKKLEVRVRKKKKGIKGPSPTATKRKRKMGRETTAVPELPLKEGNRVSFKEHVRTHGQSS